LVIESFQSTDYTDEHGWLAGARDIFLADLRRLSVTLIDADGLLAQGIFFVASNYGWHGWLAGARDIFLADLCRLSVTLIGTDGLACARFFFHGLTRMSTDGLLAQGVFFLQINTD
jgi:hypothetical protein